MSIVRRPAAVAFVPERTDLERTPRGPAPRLPIRVVLELDHEGLVRNQFLREQIVIDSAAGATVSWGRGPNYPADRARAWHASGAGAVVPGRTGVRSDADCQRSREHCDRR